METCHCFSVIYTCTADKPTQFYGDVSFWNELSGSFAQIENVTVFLTGSARKQGGTRREGEFMGTGLTGASVINGKRSCLV